jgi:hypothetical protein
MPPPSKAPDLGAEPAQLHRLADAIEAHLRRAQEETKQAIWALKQEQKVVIDKNRVVQQEKASLHTNFEEEKAHIHQEKEQLLAKKARVK